jgi:histidine triad (HIT) family protein
MAEECIFCRIVAGEIPAGMVYQDKDFLAFRDIMPKHLHTYLSYPRPISHQRLNLLRDRKILPGAS